MTLHSTLSRQTSFTVMDQSKCLRVTMLLLAFLGLYGLMQGKSQSPTNISSFEDASYLIPELPQISSSSVAWADYDSDGRLDLLMTGDDGSNFVSKLYHNTAGGFEDASYLIPDLPQVSGSSIAWGDYDSDGKPDLILTGFAGPAPYITKLYHNTGVNFEDQSGLLPDLPHVSGGSVAWADYDNDGKLDLMITGNTNTTTYAAKLYHNTGTGFEDASALMPDLPQVGFSAIAWADYDGDGGQDLLITGKSVNGPVSKLYHNTGSGFEDQSALIPNLIGIVNGAAAWGDYDNDGRPDLLMTGIANGNVNSIKFYHNTTGGFVDLTRTLPDIQEVATGSVAWVDFDKDDRLDMMITGAVGEKAISTLFHNTGSGFEDRSDLLPNLPGVASSSLAWGDYDNDDWPDLLLTGFTGERNVAKLYHNKGGEIDGTLAIVLGNITAMNQGDRNLIKWNTLYEDLGDYFEIEKSTNGSEFYTLSKLNTRGLASAYTVYDEKPAEGINYYRLKTHHKSGGFTTSKIVSAFGLRTEAFAIEAFPNPVKDKLTINIHGSISGKATISVINSIGSKVLQSNITQSPVTLDLSKLPKGIYIVKYSDDKKTETMKIIRQ